MGPPTPAPSYIHHLVLSFFFLFFLACGRTLTFQVLFFIIGKEGISFFPRVS